MHKAEMDQSNLSKKMIEFNDRSRPRTSKGKDKEKDAFEGVNALYEGRKLIFNAFKSEIFPIKETKREWSKILTPKQMLKGYT